METIDVSAGARPAPAPVPGKSVVLVPYYSAVEKECDDGLRAWARPGSRSGARRSRPSICCDA